MIAHEFEYSSPTQLSEALPLLADGAKPLAGGMSLVPMMKLRLATPEHVVDIRRIKELNYVTVSPDGVRSARRSAIIRSSLRKSCEPFARCFAKTAACIGDVQVRNMGTLGGSVAHADPSADYLAALFALEAKVGLPSAKASEAHDRRVHRGPVHNVPSSRVRSSREIIVPAEQSGTKTAYVKMSQPASGFAMVGIAVRSVARPRARLISSHRRHRCWSSPPIVPKPPKRS